MRELIQRLRGGTAFALPHPVPLLSLLTPAGRTAALLLLVSTAGAVGLGYAELALVAILCALVLGLGLAFVLVPEQLTGTLDLHPRHTVVGEAGTARLAVTNQGRLPLLEPSIRIPVGPAEEGAGVSVRLPVLRPGVEHVSQVRIPAPRRGVLRVGPAALLRGDPLGLFERPAPWTRSLELHVRPRIVPVGSLAPGFVRDLEGVPSDEVSMSDLAFHALREYVVGDDLRHVHWRSSARTGTLHVRQYHDTRRSHAVLVVDDAARSYLTTADFELALEVAASLVVRLALDDQDLSYVCGPEEHTGSVQDVLDAFCRAELAPGRASRLPEDAQRAARLAPDASRLIVVTGSRLTASAVLDVRRAFADEVRFLGFRTGASTGPSSGAAVLDLAALDELPGLVALEARGLAGR